MYELVMKKMREGDWGAVARLLREQHGTTRDRLVRQEGGSARPVVSARRRFAERFETVRLTPRRVADAVVEDNGRFKGIEINGAQFTPSQRFLKGLAQRMKVSFSIFELFTPALV